MWRRFVEGAAAATLFQSCSDSENARAGIGGVVTSVAGSNGEVSRKAIKSFSAFADSAWLKPSGISERVAAFKDWMRVLGIRHGAAPAEARTIESSFSF